MHFICEDAGSILIRAHKDLFSQATGERTGELSEIWLEFRRGGAPQWAIDQALAAGMKFDKRPRPGALGGADIPIEQWAVYVDTMAWQFEIGCTDEVREQAEALLQARFDILKVHPPKIVPPWPKYADLTVHGARTADKVAARNIETADEIGVPLEQLIDYESTVMQRDDVVAAYQVELERRQADAAEPNAIVVEA